VARHVAPLVGAEGTVVALDINPGMRAVARALPAPPGAAIDWVTALARTHEGHLRDGDPDLGSIAWGRE
jgi:hypothetical protein